MECYSEQTCALAVDGELAADEARRLRDHLTTCRRCRALVDALRAENRVLSESLQRASGRSSQPGGLLPSALVLGVGRPGDHGRGAGARFDHFRLVR